MTAGPDVPPGAAESARAPRAAVVFIFITVFIDLLGVGVLIPVIPTIVRQFAPGGFDAPTPALLRAPTEPARADGDRAAECRPAGAPPRAV